MQWFEQFLGSLRKAGYLRLLIWVSEWDGRHSAWIEAQYDKKGKEPRIPGGFSSPAVWELLRNEKLGLSMGCGNGRQGNHQAQATFRNGWGLTTGELLVFDLKEIPKSAQLGEPMFLKTTTTICRACSMEIPVGFVDGYNGKYAGTTPECDSCRHGDY
jgi:hypothetical protein